MLCVENIRYRFTVDHDFIENLLSVPADEKLTNDYFKIIFLAKNIKSKFGISVLYTSPAVKKYIQENLLSNNNGSDSSEPEATGIHDDNKIMASILFDLILNVDNTVDTESLFVSIKNCASKIGSTRFLITDSEVTKSFVTKGGSSFTVLSVKDGFAKIYSVIDGSKEYDSLKMFD